MARPAGQRLSGASGGRGPGFCRRDRQQKDRGCARVVTGDWATVVASNGAFSSPVLEVLAGREQLVALNRESLYGLDPENGQVLWSKSLPHFRGMHILTPTIWRDAIFTSPYRERSYMIDLSSAGEDWRVVESWQNKASGYMSSPVVIDDHLYLLLGNGRL
ncbi:MAG TPA: hypothetical protein EYQ18_12550 [Candidatus Handelsmanbacteria bacterium]|nr:hypothetical protein [Candidatus Handelsmanbacteria bacterium]